MNRIRTYFGVITSAAALALAAASAYAADPLAVQIAANERYEVYFDASDLRNANDPYDRDSSGDWGSLRAVGPTPGNLTDNGRPTAFGYSGPGGIAYFTPSLSGLRVGIGAAATPENRSGAEYTRLGPRIRPQRDAASNWQVGGTLGYSGFELGANLGDHTAPGCEPGSGCKTNDFWDVGVALRIGSGAVSAAYTASQPRTAANEDAGRIDIFSFNAGYSISPGFDVYGGVDWIDPNSTADSGDAPTDTRFMLGTNLRF